MIETLAVIASLCVINIGAMGVKIEDIRKEQISCHKYYVSCLDSKKSFVQCIKERQ